MCESDLPPYTYRCQQCGRYVASDEAFYDKENDDDFTLVVEFCSEKCADKKRENAIERSPE
jgi:predicted nucleic acid-binding Zn ribbon protein